MPKRQSAGRQFIRAAGLALLPALLLTGCWDRKELNDLAIIMGSGLDKPKGANRIEVSAQFIAPKQVGGGKDKSGQAGGGEEPTLARISKGVTISDALSKMQENLPRRLFWGHSKVLVIGEELAKEGDIRDYLDFMARHPRTRLNSYVFIKKGKASELMTTVTPLEITSSEVIRELANSEVGVKKNIKDVLEDLSSDREATLIPWVENSPWLSNGQKQKHGFRMKGAAVIKKGRMVRYLDDSLVRGTLWLRNEIHHPTITVSLKDTEGYVSMLQLKARTELIPEIDGDRWRMKVKVVTEDDILENSTNLVLSTPRFLSLLERAAEKEIKSRIERSLQAIQKGAKADVLGFADAFERKYPRKWEQSKKRWDEIFSGLEVNVDVRTKVRRPGLSTMPQGKTEEQRVEK